MPMSIASPPQEIVPRIREAISGAIPGAEVEVEARGSHFKLVVVSRAFEGKRTLQKQRMVLSAIKHLMEGDNPPVHAIDALETRTP